MLPPNLLYIISKSM